jgi:hypothetical protein
MNFHGKGLLKEEMEDMECARHCKLCIPCCLPGGKGWQRGEAGFRQGHGEEVLRKYQKKSQSWCSHIHIQRRAAD